jgi:hypothetical protein
VARTPGKALVKAAVIAAGLLLLVGAILHMQVEKNTAEKAAYPVVPKVDSDQISEIGYIFEVRDEINYRDRIRNVMWWVKVPHTNKLYSCSWEGGFHGFKKHDGVRIIHKRADPDQVDYSGYLVGLHGDKVGRVASVWALDVEEIELNR